MDASKGRPQHPGRADRDAINAEFRAAMDAGAEPSIWTMTEAHLHAAVTALCDRMGVWWVHVDTPHHNKGASLKGFPDLHLVGTRTAYRELKTMRGTMSPEQTGWKHRLVGAGADWGLWRPEDLQSGRIEREIAALARGQAAR